MFLSDAQTTHVRALCSDIGVTVIRLRGSAQRRGGRPVALIRPRGGAPGAPTLKTGASAHAARGHKLPLALAWVEENGAVRWAELQEEAASVASGQRRASKPGLV